MFAMKFVIDITSNDYQIIISWSIRLQLVILRLQNVTSYTSSFKNVVQGRLRKKNNSDFGALLTGLLRMGLYLRISKFLNYRKYHPWSYSSAFSTDDSQRFLFNVGLVGIVCYRREHKWVINTLLVENICSSTPLLWWWYQCSSTISLPTGKYSFSMVILNQ